MATPAVPQPNPGRTSARQRIRQLFRGRTDDRLSKDDLSERLFHLMDGLLYPGVVGAGLVVLGMRIVSGYDGWRDFARLVVNAGPRIPLGVLTLVIYSASFMAFKDLEERHYKKEVFFADALEVVVVFGCFSALRLLDPNDHAPIHRWWFGILLGFDLVILQPVWCRVAADDKDAAWDFWGIRALLMVPIVLGLVTPYAILFTTMSILIVLWYEFKVRQKLAIKSDIA